MGVAKKFAYRLVRFSIDDFFRRVSIFPFGSSMYFGGWGGGRVVKVGFWVDGCTDWHTALRKCLAFMVGGENMIVKTV